jgi:hypothetical protein
MSLPNSRNRTYAPNQPVFSADLNALQDQIVLMNQRLNSLYLANWTEISGGEGGFNDIAQGAGLIVAVGRLVPVLDTQIVTSPDGVTWTTRVAENGQSLRGVVWSGALFVSVGFTGQIRTSPDGITWTQRTPAGGFSDPGDDFFGVTWDGSLFVAVGTAGEIQTSPDGITWTQRTPAGGYSGDFRGVDYFDGLLVAVGTAGEIQTSPDGITWTARSAAGGYAGEFNGVTGGEALDTSTGDQDTLFVAVGTAGEIQTSPDGITWTARSAAGGYVGEFNGVGWGGSNFVIVGNDAEAQSSNNGIDWFKRALPGDQIDQYDAAFFTADFWLLANGNLTNSPGKFLRSVVA